MKPAEDDRRRTPAALNQESVDQAALHAAKQTLRDAVRRRRASRPDHERQADDLARHDLLVTALGNRHPARVAAYLSAGNEPNTLRLVAWLAAHDVRVLLPVLTDGAGTVLPDPAWGSYEGPDALREGRFEIAEPTGAPLPAAALREAEIVVVPGLAANRRGDRLGRGGGWYDRALAHTRPGASVWLLLNRDEVLPAIPVQPWDRAVDALITPDGPIAAER